jgi:hypothetical protein
MHPSLLWHFQRHPPPAQPIAFSCSCKYSIVGNSVITCLWTKFNDPPKKTTLDLNINPTQRLLYTSWLSYLLAQAPIYDAIPRIILENIMDTVVPALFFGVNFYHLLTNKNSVWLLQRNFGEKICQFARLSRIFFSLKLPYFGWNPSRIGSSRSPKCSRVLNFFLLFSLTCSQIGLIPLVHAHQCG